MKPEKQRIAIAEACGIVGPFDNRWIKEYEEEGGDVHGFTGFENGELVFIPDYLHDLNAMNEAEEVLRDDREAAFRGWLWLAHGQPEMRCAIVHATAAQRAEAFLRTIDKWEEEA
jgi:hypothetical protein